MRIKRLFVVALSLTLALPAFAQEKAALPAPAAGAPNVFLELGGNGAFLSLNYDMRFSKSNKGLGGRAGIGFVPGFSFLFASYSSHVTIPIALNYLAGKGPHYFEAGAGVTYESGRINFLDEETDASGFFFVPSVGYRYQPFKKGITARAVVSPFIGGESSFLLGASVGLQF